MRSRMNRNRALAIRLRKASFARHYNMMKNQGLALRSSPEENAKKPTGIPPVNLPTSTDAVWNGNSTSVPGCTAPRPLPCSCPCHVKPKRGKRLMPMPQYIDPEAPWRDLGYFLKQDLSVYEPKEEDYMEFLKFYLDTLDGKKCTRSIWLTYSHLNRCHQVFIMNKVILHGCTIILLKNNIKKPSLKWDDRAIICTGCPICSWTWIGLI